MGPSDPGFLVVGHLNRPHGTKGEIFVWPLTDHPESTFAPGVILYLGSGDDAEPDPDLPPLRVDTVRPFRKGYLVGFGGMDDRTAAERFQGHYLLRSVEELEPPAEDELFYHELLGMRVATAEGEEIGVIREVFELRPADLLEVTRPDGRPVMIPFTREIRLAPLLVGHLPARPPQRPKRSLPPCGGCWRCRRTRMRSIMPADTPSS